MNYAWSYFFVLIWLAYLVASGVLLFSRGFLLSRVSKTDVSSCRQLSLNESDEYFLNEEIVNEIFKDVNATSNLCLPQKSKVIILVIDALKYEFGVYNENLSNPLPYENKLTIFNDLLQSDPDSARLMRFKADPPTTTLQRLKGLTTGSLPTFVDMGSNFASPEINEDNIIDQIVQHGLPVVFLGDSTWTDLYPRRFKRSYSYPSFDIFDLDTVDNKIQQNLPKELAKNDWQVLIAHFLGVDHCGHKHGPLHEEMERKLNEMNEVIKFVAAKMDSGTTLLVMGDHGMTASGDHGGETEDETTALIFAYTKVNKFVGSEFGSDNTTMQQIDLVPTLATILGVPIPYSNLGIINFNLVPDVKVPYMAKFQALLLHAWQNAHQMYLYFFNYALENKRTFSVDELDNMHNEYILFTHRVKTVYNELAFKSVVRDLNANMRLILNTCREIWVKFDAVQMSQGLLFTLLPIFFAFMLINNLNALELYHTFTLRGIGYTYLINIAAGFFGYRYFKSFSFKSEEHGVIFSTHLISTLVLIFHTLQNWRTIASNSSAVRRFGNMPTRVIFIITISVFFSNSFVIEEPKILSYLLVACILLLSYEVLQKCLRSEFNKRLKWSQLLRSITLRLLLFSVLAIIFVRYTYTLFRCREEQGNCADFSNNNAGGFSLKRPASGKTYISAVVIIVLYSTLCRLYLRHSGSLTGGSPNVWLARYGPTIASICAGGHLLLAHSAVKNVKRAHIDAMALVIYGLMLVQIVVVCVSPLLTFYVLPSFTMPIQIKPWDNIVPQIFKKIKRMYDDAESRMNQMDVMVYGLTTVYSSATIVFGLFLSMVLIVLLEAHATIGMISCVAIAVVIILVHSTLRYRTAENFENCIQPTFTGIISWFLLAHFCFFATSHQTTLSQIDWRAAFVGRTSGLGNSHLISGTLVILNTFCGQVFFFSMYNLLSVSTFALCALFPKLIKSTSANGNTTNGSNANALNEGIGVDMMRGEFVLFENEGTFLAGSFKLAVQFLILQGVKVFCAMIACTIHCRHLMVWKIFAPRFIYEGIGTFVSLTALVVGYFVILRINRALDRLIFKTNKLKLE
ncbi:GPI ethanolamine phosphate transferase 3 [Ceratitis capitata]|uniref:GPI ethanolamine phosphate transferase 3, catalytic subunit n=2 Tax=Ceratitis capitata TaxID=7213 RepID=W8BEH6_CERCA|nr:GPI ethanolamine phosphate transferase 3 [Ceratitis capitata]